MKTKTPLAALITSVALLAAPAYAQQGTAPDGANTTVPPGIPPHTTPTAPDGTSPTTSPTGQVDVQTKPDLGATTPAPAQSAAPTGAPDATAPAPADATTPPPVATPAAPAETPAATPARPAMATGLLAPEGYTQVAEFSAVTPEQLSGAELRSAEGKSVGKVSDLHAGPDGVTEAVIADIGGFLGLGAHTVRLTTDQIGIFRNADDKVIVVSSLTEDVMKSLPEWEAPKQ